MKLVSNYLKHLTRNTNLKVGVVSPNSHQIIQRFMSADNKRNENIYGSILKDYYRKNKELNAHITFCNKTSEFDKKKTGHLHGVLTEDQIYGIEEGLLLKDVVGLNLAQIKALIALQHRGLTSDSLFGQDWFCSDYHIQALMYLAFRKNDRSPMGDSLKELDGLDRMQAFGITEGLTTKEVKGLNKEQIIALIALKDHGLTADDFRGNDSFFTHYHKEALLYLVFTREPSMSAKAALEELNGLDVEQAVGIMKGLTKNEVFGLNECQINTLVSLKKYGLTNQDLRGKDWFCNYDHERALYFLMVSRTPCMMVRDAMKELNGLSPYQAEGIAEGLSRSDVLRLTVLQIQALIELKENGVTAAHLRNQDWFCDIAHKNALLFLIDKRSPVMTVERAMKELYKLDKEQVCGIMKGFSREDILRSDDTRTNRFFP